MFLVSPCCCLCPIHWSHVWSWEWRCSWSSADRRCSNYIWVINNFIAYYKVRLILETLRYTDYSATTWAFQITGCLFNKIFRLTTKETLELLMALCEGPYLIDSPHKGQVWLNALSHSWPLVCLVAAKVLADSRSGVGVVVADGLSHIWWWRRLVGAGLGYQT